MTDTEQQKTDQTDHNKLIATLENRVALLEQEIDKLKKQQVNKSKTAVYYAKSDADICNECLPMNMRV